MMVCLAGDSDRPEELVAGRLLELRQEIVSSLSQSLNGLLRHEQLTHGLVVACVVAFLLELGKRVRADATEDSEEFAVLQAEALDPTRLLTFRKNGSRAADGRGDDLDLNHPNAALADAGTAKDR